MALTKDSVKIINNVTLAANGTATSSGIDLTSALDACIGVSVTFNASTTNDVKVEFFGDPTGEIQDFTIGANDIPFDFFIIPYISGVVTAIIPFEKSPKYAKVRLTNQSATYTVTAANVWTMIQNG